MGPNVLNLPSTLNTPGLTLNSTPGLNFGASGQPTPTVSTASLTPTINPSPGSGTAQVNPLKINTQDFFNQARGSAESSQNPYYTTQLNQFVAQQAADKAIHQQQAQMNIQQLQAQLQNTLQGNQISGARTSQDVLQNEQQIGIKADQTQQDQGTQFDQARIAQAKQLASQGLTTSGAGAQQVLGSETDRNTQEARQAQDVAQQNQAQELFKNRTFEDLARSGELAKQSETTGETQQNFDLNNYIAQQGRDYTTTTQNIEKSRLGDVASETQRQAKILFNNYLNTISNPAQRLATAQAYSGAF